MKKSKARYRNKFETAIGEVLKDYCEYESLKVPYVVHRNYTPDFIGKNIKTKIEVLVEAKGYFRANDTQKYKAIRDSLPKEQVLVFILYNPDKKIRKGSKMTMAGWCDKEKIYWYTLESIQDAFTG